MKTYDLIVIGAGIHGAGVAQAAAAAGMSVLVLEQHQPAYGTSSRSSKLIHGGLRYLESAQFKLVRESLRERALMLKNAPELVSLKPFYIPIYKHTRRRPWQIRTGLSLYALLGGFQRGSLFGAIPRRQWHRLDGLNTYQLQKVFRYYDGQTDDAALTNAVLRSAHSLGADIHVEARMQAAELNADGGRITYAESGGSFETQARVLINATGPWINRTLSLIAPAQTLRPIELVQGSHILLPGAVTQGIYYVESPRDGRAVFVMPWRGQTLVGTTETRFRGDPERVHPSPSETHYLLQVLKTYFPTHHHQTAADIVRSFAGLRVLPTGKGHAFHRPRETLFETDRIDKPRLLSIYGGKLTGWRATAEQVMQRILPSLPARATRADTRTLKLSPE